MLPVIVSDIFTDLLREIHILRKKGKKTSPPERAAQIRDNIAAAACLFVEYFVAEDGYPSRIIRPLRLVFRKNHIRCGVKQFFACYFLSEQSERHRVILTDTLCRAGGSGGKERQKTCIIPYLHRPMSGAII